MKPKTERKLIKRELLKSKHHIDTCVIIESAEETKSGEICRRYLNLVGYKYRGCFSLPVLGEFLMKILTEVKSDVKKEISFRYFYELVRDKKINFYTPKILSLPSEITKLDGRINFTDASIVACTIEDNAILVTLDAGLLHSKEIEEQYKIKIKHPKELS